MKLRPGFTLFELLIAIAILGLIVVLLDQGVAFGVRATATQQQIETRHGDLDAVDRVIRQLIAQADPGGPSVRAPFRGSAGAVTLVSELPLASGERERVEARLDASGGALRLHWTRRRHVKLAAAPPPPDEKVLLDGVTGLELAYAGPNGWQPNWTAERLPSLVRLTLRFSDDRRRWPPIEVRPQRETLAP